MDGWIYSFIHSFILLLNLCLGDFGQSEAVGRGTDQSQIFLQLFDQNVGTDYCLLPLTFRFQNKFMPAV